MQVHKALVKEIEQLPLDYLARLQRRSIPFRKGLANLIHAYPNVPPSKQSEALNQIFQYMVERRTLFWKSTSESEKESVFLALIRTHAKANTVKYCQILFKPGQYRLPLGQWQPDFHWLLDKQDHERIFTWLLLANRLGFDHHIQLKIARMIYR